MEFIWIRQVKRGAPSACFLGGFFKEKGFGGLREDSFTFEFPLKKPHYIINVHGKDFCSPTALWFTKRQITPTEAIALVPIKKVQRIFPSRRHHLLYGETALPSQQSNYQTYKLRLRRDLRYFYLAVQ